MDKTEILDKIFASAFTNKCSSCTAWVPGDKGRDWENEELPTTGEDLVWDHPRNPWDLMSSNCRSWGNWQLKLLSHYPPYSRSCGRLVKIPLTGKREGKPPFFLKRPPREIQGTHQSPISACHGRRVRVRWSFRSIPAQSKPFYDGVLGTIFFLHIKMLCLIAHTKSRLYMDSLGTLQHFWH